MGGGANVGRSGYRCTETGCARQERVSSGGAETWDGDWESSLKGGSKPRGGDERRTVAARKPALERGT